jgi:hypothetical protein
MSQISGVPAETELSTSWIHVYSVANTSTCSVWRHDGRLQPTERQYPYKNSRIWKSVYGLEIYTTHRVRWGLTFKVAFKIKLSKRNLQVDYKHYIHEDLRELKTQLES